MEYLARCRKNIQLSSHQCSIILTGDWHWLAWWDHLQLRQKRTRFDSFRQSHQFKNGARATSSYFSREKPSCQNFLRMRYLRLLPQSKSQWDRWLTLLCSTQLYSTLYDSFLSACISMYYDFLFLCFPVPFWHKYFVFLDILTKKPHNLLRSFYYLHIQVRLFFLCCD